ncbi:hypothetical protein KCP74_07295 [Salmonella enterica subsp. enterica]|nr:hypothetical protein KCP74_07295 [Salmonella enterica subsp. enterica]
MWPAGGDQPIAGTDQQQQQALIDDKPVDQTSCRACATSVTADTMAHHQISDNISERNAPEKPSNARRHRGTDAG